MYIQGSEWAAGRRDLSPIKGEEGNAGKTLLNILSNAGQLWQAQQQDKLLRTAASNLLGLPAEQIPVGLVNREFLQDALTEKMKASWNPDNMLYNKILSGSNQQGGSDISGTSANGSSSKVDPSMLMRGLISKKFGIPYEQMMTPEERKQKSANDLQGMIKKKELESMATMLPKLDQAFQAVGQLEDLYRKGATPDKDPLVARATGIPDAIVAKMGFNPDLNTYFKNLKAFSGLISKGGFGEAGMLTNQDIQRIVDAFPTSGSSQAEADKGFTEIKKILGAARDRFTKTKEDYLNISSGNSSGSSGSPNVLDKETAAMILKEVGGDKIKAREIAKQRGYTF